MSILRSESKLPTTPLSMLSYCLLSSTRDELNISPSFDVELARKRPVLVNRGAGLNVAESSAEGSPLLTRLRIELGI